MANNTQKKIAELFGVLLHLFGEANPKVIPHNHFTKKERAALTKLVRRYRFSKTPENITKLAKLYLKIISCTDKMAYHRAKVMVSKSSLVPAMIRSNILKKTSELNFATASPAGPARFARVPLFPMRDEDAWSSRYINIDTASPNRQAFGIEAKGDDPILSVGPFLSTDATPNKGPYPMVSRKVEFGAYRLIGIEICAQYGNRYLGAVLDGVAATGAIEVVGTPTAATGTVEAVGPAAVQSTVALTNDGPSAVRAEGELTFTGSSLPALGTIDFTGVPTASTGSVDVVGAQVAAEALLTIASAEAAASGSIDINGNTDDTINTIQFEDGVQASATLTFSGTPAPVPLDAILTIEINGTQEFFQFKNALSSGPVLGVWQVYRGATPTMSSCMEELSRVINGVGAGVTSASTLVTASESSEIVTVTAIGEGTIANYTQEGFLLDDPANAATFNLGTSTPQFSGGLDSLVITENARAEIGMKFTGDETPANPASTDMHDTIFVLDSGTGVTNNYHLWDTAVAPLPPDAGDDYYADITGRQFFTGCMTDLITKVTAIGLFNAQYDGTTFAVRFQLETLEGTSTDSGTYTLTLPASGELSEEYSVGFTGGQDAITVSVETSAGTTVYTPIEDGAIPGAGEIEVSPTANTQATRFDRDVVVNPPDSSSVLTDTVTLTVDLTATTLVTFSSTWPTEPTVTMTQQGQGCLTTNSIITLTATDGTVETLTEGTDFNSTRVDTTTATNLNAAVDALTDFSSSVSGGTQVDIDQDTAGRAGNTTITYSGTPADVSISSFTGGSSPVPLGINFTLQDTTGILPDTHDFESTDGTTDANNFDSEQDLATTIAALLTMFTANTVFDGSATGNPDEVNITQQVLGTLGNGRATNDNGNAEFTFSGNFASGEDAVDEDTTVQLIDTNGTSATFTYKVVPAGGLQISNQGTAATIASSSETVINAHAIDITANTVGTTINLTQDIEGSGGDTTITVALDPGAKLTETNFSGGVSAFPVGQSITITDALAVSETFFATENTETGTQFMSKGTVAESLDSLADAIALSVLTMSAVEIAGTLQLAQSFDGTVGNVAITQSGLGTATLVGMAGGTDTVVSGTTVTVQDADGTTVPFVAGTDFVIVGSPTVVADSFGTAVNGTVGLETTALAAVGGVITLRQQAYGTIGNGQILTALPGAQGIAVSAPFAGGVDNVTLLGTLTLVDAAGVGTVFEAVGSGAVHPQFNVVQEDPAITMSNLNAAINDAGLALDYTSVIDGGDPTQLNVTQDTYGTIGDKANTDAIVGIAVPNFTGGVDNVTIGTTVTVEDSFAVSFPFVAGTDFAVVQETPATTMSNFAAAVTAWGGNVTGSSVGTTATLTQGTAGPDGNTTILSSDDSELEPTGFSGGTFSVELGSIITLEDTDGTIATFTAVDGATTATTYDVQPSISDTLDNLLTAIGLSGIDISGVNNSPILDLTQDQSGSGGNNTITVTNDATPATLSPSGFTGGTNMSLNLVNPLSPIALSMRELTVYNGDNILIVEDSEAVSVGDFNVLSSPETFQYTFQYPLGNLLTPTGQPAAVLPVQQPESDYIFVGLRDQPIVDANSHVLCKIEAFMQSVPTYDGAYPADTPLPKIPPISLSMNLIVDLLEDKIFGDPLVPSPASRAAANIKLGTQDIGNNRIRITNAVSKK